MNKKKLDTLVVNYKLNINIDDFDNSYLITIYVVIKYKFIAKDFVYLYYDNEVNVNFFDKVQYLRNAIV